MKPACKPGSVGVIADAVTIIHLGPRLPAGSSHLPADSASSVVIRLFGVAPGGGYRAVRVPTDAVRSYRTLSPLPDPQSMLSHRLPALSRRSFRSFDEPLAFRRTAPLETRLCGRACARPQVRSAIGGLLSVALFIALGRDSSRLIASGRYPAPCSTEPGLSSMRQAHSDRPAGFTGPFYAVAPIHPASFLRPGRNTAVLS